MVPFPAEDFPVTLKGVINDLFQCTDGDSLIVKPDDLSGRITLLGHYHSAFLAQTHPMAISPASYVDHVIEGRKRKKGTPEIEPVTQQGKPDFIKWMQHIFAAQLGEI